MSSPEISNKNISQQSHVEKNGANRDHGEVSTPTVYDTPPALTEVVEDDEGSESFFRAPSSRSLWAFVQTQDAADGATRWTCWLCQVHGVGVMNGHVHSTEHQNREKMLHQAAMLPTDVGTFATPQYHSTKDCFRMGPYQWTTCRLVSSNRTTLHPTGMIPTMNSGGSSSSRPRETEVLSVTTQESPRGLAQVNAEDVLKEERSSVVDGATRQVWKTDPGLLPQPVSDESGEVNSVEASVLSKESVINATENGFKPEEEKPVVIYEDSDSEYELIMSADDNVTLQTFVGDADILLDEATYEEAEAAPELVQSHEDLDLVAREDEKVSDAPAKVQHPLIRNDLCDHPASAAWNHDDNEDKDSHSQSMSIGAVKQHPSWLRNLLLWSLVLLSCVLFRARWVQHTLSRSGAMREHIPGLIWDSSTYHLSDGSKKVHYESTKKKLDVELSLLRELTVPEFRDNETPLPIQNESFVTPNVAENYLSLPQLNFKESPTLWTADVLLQREPPSVSIAKFEVPEAVVKCPAVAPLEVVLPYALRLPLSVDIVQEFAATGHDESFQQPAFVKDTNTKSNPTNLLKLKITPDLFDGYWV